MYKSIIILFFGAHRIIFREKRRRISRICFEYYKHSRDKGGRKRRGKDLNTSKRRSIERFESGQVDSSGLQRLFLRDKGLLICWDTRIPLSSR